ncbi:MAG TPA: hypothetical protein VJR29_00355 [bacterium]|nr:hypothetical protein [bacterium]
MKSKLLLLISFLLVLSFWNWIALGFQALAYPRSESGAASNVVAQGPYAYASLGGEGLAIVELASGRKVETLAPPRGSGSVDDLAVADGWLFVLDAEIPGHLSVYSLADPAQPRLVEQPREIDVGPFSGVSAAAGKVIVSGGTSRLSLLRYDAQGRLGSEIVFADLGRGQPDILLRPDGKGAVVSSHFVGPRFGLTTLKLDSMPLGLQVQAKLELEGAGFSAGGATPANFPIEGAWAGETLLLAYGRGLGIFEVDSQGALRLRRRLELGLAAVNVDAQGRFAAVVGASPEPSLLILDLGSPQDPKVLRRIALPRETRATGVALAGDKVVVAAQNQGVLTFNTHP